MFYTLGKWECPWHHCDECGKSVVKLCTECPNSFCKSHIEGNIFDIGDGILLCSDHDDILSAIEPSRIKMPVLGPNDGKMVVSSSSSTASSPPQTSDSDTEHALVIDESRMEEPKPEPSITDVLAELTQPAATKSKKTPTLSAILASPPSASLSPSDAKPGRGRKRSVDMKPGKSRMSTPSESKSRDSTPGSKSRDSTPGSQGKKRGRPAGSLNKKKKEKGEDKNDSNESLNPSSTVEVSNNNTKVIETSQNAPSPKAAIPVFSPQAQVYAPSVPSPLTIDTKEKKGKGRGRPRKESTEKSSDAKKKGRPPKVKENGQVPSQDNTATDKVPSGGSEKEEGELSTDDEFGTLVIDC